MALFTDMYSLWKVPAYVQSPNCQDNQIVQNDLEATHQISDVSQWQVEGRAGWGVEGCRLGWHYQ